MKTHSPSALLPSSPALAYDFAGRFRRAARRALAAVALAALAVALGGGGAALADHGNPNHAATTDTKFCFKVDSGASNHWITGRDNWLKTKVLMKKCQSCSLKQVEEVHTENDSSRGNWKCGPTRTVDTPNYWGNEAKSGKIDLTWGSDITFDAHGAGPFCFVGYRKSGDHVNPWKIEYDSDGDC